MLVVITMAGFWEGREGLDHGLYGDTGCHNVEVGGSFVLLKPCEFRTVAEPKPEVFGPVVRVDGDGHMVIRLERVA